MSPLFTKFASRKFLLALATVIYSVVKDDPKYAAIASGIYIVVQGYIDAYVPQEV